LDEDGICIPSKTYREEPFSCTRPYIPETCGIFLEMRRKGKITTPAPKEITGKLKAQAVIRALTDRPPLIIRISLTRPAFSEETTGKLTAQ